MAQVAAVRRRSPEERAAPWGDPERERERGAEPRREPAAAAGRHPEGRLAGGRRGQGSKPHRKATGEEKNIEEDGSSEEEKKPRETPHQQLTERNRVNWTPRGQNHSTKQPQGVGCPVLQVWGVKGPIF